MVISFNRRCDDLNNVRQHRRGFRRSIDHAGVRWISEGWRRVKEIRRSDYTVLGTLEYGPIRAQDPRFPWQGLVSCFRGVGLAGGRVRGTTRRGGVPALGNGSKPAGLVGPGGSWEQSCRSCQTSFCRGRTSSLSWLSDSLAGGRWCLCSSDRIAWKNQCEVNGIDRSLRRCHMVIGYFSGIEDLTNDW